MADLIVEVEARRQAARMSQAEVAREVGISQGQYSKVVAGKVALTAKMSVKMRRWLSGGDSPQADIDREILLKCIDLMQLLQRRYGSRLVAPADRS